MHRFAALPSLACIVFLAACGGAQPAPGARSQSPALAVRIRSVENGLIPGGVPVGSAPAPASLESRMRHYHVPGVSVAVIADGRIDWARGYGVTEADATQRVDTATLFQGASISKVVTTVAALRLVEQGRLGLDEDVNARLTAWRVPESPYTREQKVTLRRILTHTSGLTVSGFAGYPRGEPVPTLLQVLRGDPPANSEAIRPGAVPGSVQRYSGGGFTVAQLLIGEAAGLPFETALDRLVLRPVGMIHSTFQQPLPGSLEREAASGHRADGSPVAGRWRTHPEQAAAGLWSTPSDLARFAIAIQRAAAGQGGGLLSPAMAREMVTPQVGPSGLGFVVMGEGERRIFRHSGSNAGFRARMVAYVGGGRGAVVMTNGDAGEALIDEILASIARAYGWPEGTPTL
jgi:CubicO group peptidase (beta-lactamase class C family)